MHLFSHTNWWATKKVQSIWVFAPGKEAKKKTLQVGRAGGLCRLMNQCASEGNLWGGVGREGYKRGQLHLSVSRSAGGPCAAEDLRMWSSWEINLPASVELDQLVSQGLWSRQGATIWAGVPGRQRAHGGIGRVYLPVWAWELGECQGKGG